MKNLTLLPGRGLQMALMEAWVDFQGHCFPIEEPKRIVVCLKETESAPLDIVVISGESQYELLLI